MRFFLYAFLGATFLLFIGCKNDDSNEVAFEHPLQDIEDQLDEWNWVDIEGMICRDGSPTGIGLRVDNPKKLAIYINGGGACFNELTCNSNPSNFTEETFFSFEDDLARRGIFNIEDDRNPLKDWSFVFIPYCTGDVHSGTKYNGKALGVNETQRFVGAFNFKKVMRYIAPYFLNKGVEEVLLFGVSAGGYGVYINFLEIVKWFPDVRMNVINDSGPLFQLGEGFPLCLQIGFGVVFGLQIPLDLYGCCDPFSGLANVFEYSAQKYPQHNYGFISSYEDRISRFFLSFGQNDCGGIEGNSVPADIFRNALVDLRDNLLKPKTTWSTFYIEGNTHTMLVDSELLYEREVDGMYLYEWMNRLLAGEVMHVTE